MLTSKIFNKSWGDAGRFNRFLAMTDDQIDADGDSDLRLDGVEGVAEEMFDRQILLDPLEEGLNLPTLAINFYDRESWQIEAIEWNKPQQLRDDRLIAIRRAPSFAKKTGNDTGKKTACNLNRRNRESRLNPRHCWIKAK
jgi:hypothetical protein